MQMDVENMTCTSGRNLIILQKDLRNMDEETLFVAYAESLLGQMPCARMNNNTRRNQLFLDPSLKGIIYHTIKFCDYYGFEYASIKNNIKVPLLKLETDFTSQSAGQLLTRIQAFAETIEGSDDMHPHKTYVRLALRLRFCKRLYKKLPVECPVRISLICFLQTKN